MHTPTEDRLESVNLHRRRRWRAAVPWAVLAGALMVTLMVAASVRAIEESRDREYFQNAVQSTQDRIRTRVSSWIEMLSGTAGLFSFGGGELTPEEFREYVHRLDLPERWGVEAVGFSRRLLPDEDEATVRQVWELPADARLPPPGEPRDAVVMVEPLDARNRRALGVAYLLPEARHAMLQAVDDGGPAATPMLLLPGDPPDKRPSALLLFVPVFKSGMPTSTVEERRAAIHGHVFGLLRAPAMFQGFFGTEATPRVGFEIFDGATVDPSRRIHRSWPGALEGSSLPFQEQVRMRVAGHQFWVMRIHGRGADRVPVVPFVLVAGFALAGLLFLAMLGQVRGRHAAERVASELRRSARSLRRSERRLRTLIERLPEAVAVYQRGRVVFCNPAMELMLRASTRLVGSDAFELVAADDRAELARALRAIEGGNAPGGSSGRGNGGGEESGPVANAETLSLELRFLAGGPGGAEPGAELLQSEGFLLPLEFDGLPAALGVWRDVTQRRQLVARMMQMDRMIAVGTLAAGVAHEINNPLAYVTANLDYVLGELGRPWPPATGTAAVGASRPVPLDAEAIQALVEARDGAERVRRIVRDLKTFSRSGADEAPAEHAPVDVRRAIQWACDMAENEIRHRARLRIEVTAESLVECEEARLGQVLLNLVMNAAHAIPEGNADRNRITVSARDSEAGTVIIEVHDTGEGIPASNLGRIFDPFFTTKPVGVGTGLGLAIVQRLVTSFGGHLTVESEEGHGSTFRVELPATRQDATASPVASASPAASPLAERDLGPISAPSRPRLLVIDDEVQVLRSIQRNLGPSFEVVGLTRAEEALERLRAGERFDAVICDLMMPEMTGMDLHAALSADGSEVARSMVFITGGAFTPRARDFLASVDNPRLEKPFDMAALVAALRRPGPAAPSVAPAATRP